MNKIGEINKLAKDNDNKYNNLQERFDQVSEELKNTKEKFYISAKQNSELKEKVRQYEVLFGNLLTSL